MPPSEVIREMAASCRLVRLTGTAIPTARTRIAIIRTRAVIRKRHFLGFWSYILPVSGGRCRF
jgi:hypothetical protein